MSSSIPFLDLPIQGFVLGSAGGMLWAMAVYQRTGELERWPLYVGYGALFGLGLGFLLAILPPILLDHG